MFCARCGNAIDSQGSFCPNCGAPHSGASIPAGTSSAPQAIIPPPPPPPPPLARAQPAPRSVDPAMPARENDEFAFSSAKVVTDAALAAIAAMPPIELVTPADEDPERIIDIFEGTGRLRKSTRDGYWYVTNQRFLFFEFDPGKKPSKDDIAREISSADNYLIQTRNIHSIVYEKSWGCEVSIFSYDGEVHKFDLASKICGKKFMPAARAAVPGVTIVKKSIFLNYYANISELDPRNPFGSRYDPRYPRGYIVARPGWFKQDPARVAEAINSGKRDGSLPMDWNRKITGKESMPPGVPCLMM